MYITIAWIYDCLIYTSDREFAYIGITAYAQNQLGEVLFVEMPEVGDELNQGEEYGVVESSKVASD